ncbi:MAG: isoprenylcysteine carboxylmethyltransferase family protein [Spirochaetes bacterium]|nr:isoprenylcysteine carboxylmethyltransferase family protein [Spirochaetota bacterium]
MDKKEKFQFSKKGLRGILRSLILFGFIFGVCLLIAGRLDYYHAWLMFGLYLSLQIMYVLVLLKTNPELINERGSFIQENTKKFDKIFYALWIPLRFVIFIVAALDAGRFSWSHMPVYIVAGGAIITILMSILGIWAMSVNRFFATTVKIQNDRGHEVCDFGPYRFVRHPGYVAMFFSAITLPVIMGSWWAMIPGGITGILVIIRTALEDQTLRRELKGYEEFTSKTRYRLIPLLW